jgi:hypothetical protein
VPPNVSLDPTDLPLENKPTDLADFEEAVQITNPTVPDWKILYPEATQAPPEQSPAELTGDPRYGGMWIWDSASGTYRPEHGPEQVQTTPPAKPSEGNSLFQDILSTIPTPTQTPVVTPVFTPTAAPVVKEEIIEDIFTSTIDDSTSMLDNLLADIDLDLSGEDTGAVEGVGTGSGSGSGTGTGNGDW